MNDFLVILQQRDRDSTPSWHTYITTGGIQCRGQYELLRRSRLTDKRCAATADHVKHRHQRTVCIQNRRCKRPKCR